MNAKNIAYSFFVSNEQVKNFSKYIIFNDDGKEEKCRRGEFPLVSNEYNKRLTPFSPIRVIQERHKQDVIFNVHRYISVNHQSRPDDVVAMDPGIPTFMITYNTNVYCTGSVDVDIKRVFPLFAFG